MTTPHRLFLAGALVFAIVATAWATGDVRSTAPATSIAAPNDWPAPPLLKNASTKPGIVEFDLTASPARLELIPGKQTETWAYNGMVPGPTIELREGDLVTIHFHNRVAQRTTAHWHGLHPPAGSDGSPLNPVMPGRTRITCSASTTPGKGNFPMRPHYVAPPMPWPAWRHMTDADLKAIAAYLTRGVKPVAHKVPDSEGPPDFWASVMVPENIGVYPVLPFPAANEQQPPANQKARVARGRALVLDHGCGDCHQGNSSPEKTGWLGGITNDTQAIPIGPCLQDPKAPCFMGRPKNLTPDKETGIGRWTDQQVFNALRYGLKPQETPDVQITSSTPGQGNFPKEPKYLGPFMPWASWRHMSDEDLWSIIAYLRHAVKPIKNDVKVSDDAPDHWASAVAKIGAHPSPAFPTANEVKK